jgi:hypothetical protein
MREDRVQMADGVVFSCSDCQYPLGILETLRFVQYQNPGT